MLLIYLYFDYFYSENCCNILSPPVLRFTNNFVSFVFSSFTVTNVIIFPYIFSNKIMIKFLLYHSFTVIIDIIFYCFTVTNAFIFFCFLPVSQLTNDIVYFIFTDVYSHNCYLIHTYILGFSL